MHLKTIKVTNPKNVLVQIPGAITEKWNLTTNDGVEVHINEEDNSLIITPRKGYIKVFARSGSEEESDGVVRLTDGYQVQQNI